MILRYFTIFLSILLMVNSVAIDLVVVFAPSKTEVQKQMNLFPELEYPCQFHDCSCTKESCLTDCCCKKNHEVFAEMKTKPNENAPLFENKAKESNTKSKSIFKVMLCKQNKLKEYDQISLKKEIFFKERPQLIRLVSSRIFNVIIYSNQYLCLKTQTNYSPDKPPPNIS